MIEQIKFPGFRSALRLSNGEVELVVTTSAGPRIIRYAFAGEENLFAEFPNLTQDAPNGPWKPWGGHRLWVAPEAPQITYTPDDHPIAYEIEHPRCVTVRQPAAIANGFEKVMRLELSPTGSEVSVTHTIVNHNECALEVSPWALSILKADGELLLPQEPYQPHSQALAPARPLVLWSYTDLSDPRWIIGSRYLRVRPDPGRANPQKIGILNKRGWSAYRRGTTIFVKRVAYREGATYPDYSSNVEVFTAGNFLEWETLAPLERLEPGASSAPHVEHWSLHRSMANEDDIERHVLPLLTD